MQCGGTPSATPAGVDETRLANFRWSLASLGPPATVRVASGDLTALDLIWTSGRRHSCLGCSDRDEGTTSADTRSCHTKRHAIRFTHDRPPIPHPTLLLPLQRHLRHSRVDEPLSERWRAAARSLRPRARAGTAG